MRRETVWFLLIGVVLAAGITLLVLGIRSLHGDEKNIQPIPQQTSQQIPQEIEKGIIYGTVFSSIDGTAIGNVTIRAVRYPDAKAYSAKSNSADGFYSIEVPDGKYILAAEHKEYELFISQQLIDVASKIEQNIELAPRGQTKPPQNLQDLETYVFRNGAQNEQEVRVILAAHGIDANNILSIKSINLSGEDLWIYYRNGQSAAVYVGSVRDEPAWEVTLSDRSILYVSKTCGNVIKQDPSRKTITPPPAPIIPPTPIPLQIFSATAIAEAWAEASATCPDGTTAKGSGYARAEATATSMKSYEDAYQKALADAQTEAEVAARARANAEVNCARTSTSTSSPTPTPTPAPPPSPKHVIFEPMPSVGSAPLTVAFRIEALGGVVKYYVINCGGGVKQEEQCIYPNPGTYYPSIIVYFEDGDTDGGNTQVVVY